MRPRNSPGTLSIFNPKKSLSCLLAIITAMPLVKPTTTGRGMNFTAVPKPVTPRISSRRPAIRVDMSSPSTPYFAMMPNTTTTNAPVGPPIWVFVVVVFGIIAKYGVDGLLMSTLMAGILLLILGVTGLGTAVKFIPRPVVVGFTNGIAVIIASTQLKDFFGLKIDKVPGEFLARIQTVVHNFSSFSPIETTLATVALAVIILFMRYVKRVPGYIVALFLGTAAVLLFKLPVETIGTRFGGIPSGLPTLRVPHFHLDLLRPLISPAITVAMLGAIESLMSAAVSDRMSGDKHNPNVELVGQGIANILSPLFGGLPATGAIARTPTNIRSGATP